MRDQVEILSEIIQSIQRLDDGGTNSLVRKGREILNLSQISQPYRYQNGTRSAAAEFGADTFLFNAYHIDISIPDPLSVLFVNRQVLHSDQKLKSDFQVKDINRILEQCKVISFARWANSEDASQLWDRLRTNVIKPIGRKDFEFIFYLGDMEQKPVYEIDEILDIISEFSSSGRVTLVLTDREATTLWKRLNGKGDNLELSFAGINDHELRYIFNTIKIERLLVYAPDHRITILSRGGVMEMSGPHLHHTNTQYSAQNYFDAGYILGLLLQLSTAHCAAIGLTLASAYLRNEVIHDFKTLVAHIQDWIRELNKTFVELSEPTTAEMSITTLLKK